MAQAGRRKCHFNSDLEKEFGFLEKRQKNDPSVVYCTVCNNTFSIANSGRSQIIKHLTTDLHKKGEQAKASSKKLDQFFTSVKPKQEDFELAAREGTIAYHTVVHDHSFNSVTCTSKLLKAFYDAKFLCAKTKCEKIVTNVLVPASLDIVRKDLDNCNFVTASVDCSNHKSIKLMPVLLRYFSTENGIQIKLIDMHSLKCETSEVITTALLDSLAKYNVTEKLIGICADNTNTNFGGINRKGKVNVFYKLKESLGRDLVGIGCAAHIVHNSVETAADCLPLDVEAILAKIYKYFSIYTVRTESLKEFCEFVNIEYKGLLATSKTRWLSLGKSLERLLELYEGVKSYFLSESTCPKVLRSFFNNETTEIYLWFLHGQLCVFTQAILQIQKQDISGIETFIVVKNLKNLLR
ncbi:unnamed protein product [Orchesella dallaii]|uniref:Uncharacterized protein n=1 Tax=Orchesella dallaii TaxID=48710 RepID=A0ABP1R4V2_9HEXA